MHSNSQLTREQIIAKLKKRLKATKLMRKHGFTTAFKNDDEMLTLESVINWLEKGGDYYIAKKGFLSTRYGVVIL